jgi:hypothetical protein
MKGNCFCTDAGTKLASLPLETRREGRGKGRGSIVWTEGVPARENPFFFVRRRKQKRRVHAHVREKINRVDLILGANVGSSHLFPYVAPVSIQVAQNRGALKNTSTKAGRTFFYYSTTTHSELWENQTGGVGGYPQHVENRRGRRNVVSQRTPESSIERNPK